MSAVAHHLVDESPPALGQLGVDAAPVAGGSDPADELLVDEHVAHTGDRRRVHIEGHGEIAHGQRFPAVEQHEHPVLGEGDLVADVVQGPCGDADQGPSSGQHDLSRFDIHTIVLHQTNSCICTNAGPGPARRFLDARRAIRSPAIDQVLDDLWPRELHRRTGRHARAAARPPLQRGRSSTADLGAHTHADSAELRFAYLQALRTADRDPDDLQPLIDLMWW